MKYKFLLLFLNFKKENNFIINSNLPICKNCIYFIKSPDNYKYNMDKCQLFGEKDYISGEVRNEYASSCRYNEKMCGKNGKYYTEN